jgi:hypothetical protein
LDQKPLNVKRVIGYKPFPENATMYCFVFMGPLSHFLKKHGRPGILNRLKNGIKQCINADKTPFILTFTPFKKIDENERNEIF